MDTPAAFRDTRTRIAALVRAAGASAEGLPTPACPEWTVNDVLAHLAGGCDDVLAGRLDGVASDAWTEAQVLPRRGRTIEELLAEYEELAPELEAALGDGLPKQLVFDTVTHEHDLRGALGQPGAQDTDAVEIGFRFVAGGFGGSLDRNGLPGVLVRSDRSERAYGSADVAATLTASSFDLMRSFSGRRTHQQILALGWDADDPARFLAAFGFDPFRVPTEPVE